jgi:hypothetical protein
MALWDDVRKGATPGRNVGWPSISVNFPQMVPHGLPLSSYDYSQVAHLPHDCFGEFMVVANLGTQESLLQGNVAEHEFAVFPAKAFAFFAG